MNHGGRYEWDGTVVWGFVGGCGVLGICVVM